MAMFEGSPLEVPFVGAMAFAFVACAKPTAVTPPSRKQPPNEVERSSLKAELLWERLRAETSRNNHDTWFADSSADKADISNVLIRLLNEKVGACSEWKTIACDSHELVNLEVEESASVEDPCVAQEVFVQHAELITAHDLAEHASAIVELATLDPGAAARLLELSLELVPFSGDVEGYAELMLHNRGTRGDEVLRLAVLATLNAQPAHVIREAFHFLATQRTDPVVANRAAEFLAENHDGQFLPRWSSDIPLEELMFRIFMIGAQGGPLPASFVSQHGIVTQRTTHFDRGELRELDPPHTTTQKQAFATSDTFDAPWGAIYHMHPDAQKPRCVHNGDEASCSIRIAASVFATETGEMTTASFERQREGGYKLTKIKVEVWGASCEL